MKYFLVQDFLWFKAGEIIETSFLDGCEVIKAGLSVIRVSPKKYQNNFIPLYEK